MTACRPSVRIPLSSEVWSCPNSRNVSWRNSKGEMMKGVSDFVCKAVLNIVLCTFFFLPCGCSSSGQLGETAAEVHRRHERVARINYQQMMADIDEFLLLDRPSRLTDRRIP